MRHIESAGVSGSLSEICRNEDFQHEIGMTTSYTLFASLSPAQQKSFSSFLSDDCKFGELRSYGSGEEAMVFETVDNPNQLITIYDATTRHGYHPRIKSNLVLQPLVEPVFFEVRNRYNQANFRVDVTTKGVFVEEAIADGKITVAQALEAYFAFLDRVETNNLLMMEDDIFMRYAILHTDNINLIHREHRKNSEHRGLRERPSVDEVRTVQSMNNLILLSDMKTLVTYDCLSLKACGQSILDLEVSEAQRKHARDLGLEYGKTASGHIPESKSVTAPTVSQKSSWTSSLSSAYRLAPLGL